MNKALVSLICFVALYSHSFAQSYAEIEQLLDDKNYSKAESILKSRIAANANDDSAYFFLGQIPVRAGDEKKYDEAIDHFKKCVELKPSASGYHHWLGRAYGVKARDAGIFSAMGYVGDVKSSFIKAVELDPKNYEARYDLISFYLRAPGIVGGSTSKAKDVAREHEKYNPDEAKLLWTQIYIYEEEFDDAEARLFSMKRPSDNDMSRHYGNLLASLGFKYLEEEQPAKAQNIFQKFVAQFADVALGYHGLGRSLYDQKKMDEAILQFEKAISLNKAIGSQYRLGLIYEEKGDKQKAIKYLEEFLVVMQGRNDKTIDDARDRLEELKK